MPEFVIKTAISMCVFIGSVLILLLLGLGHALMGYLFPILILSVVVPIVVRHWRP